MPIRVKYGDDAVIEVDTEAELRAVLAAIGKPSAKNGHAQGSITERLSDLVKTLVGEQRRFLEVLRSAPEGLPDTEVCQLLDVDRKRLGGVLMALSKKSASLGINPWNHVVSRRIDRAADGTRRTFYRLTPEAREAIAG